MENRYKMKLFSMSRGGSTDFAVVTVTYVGTRVWAILGTMAQSYMNIKLGML